MNKIAQLAERYMGKEKTQINETIMAEEKVIMNSEASDDLIAKAEKFNDKYMSGEAKIEVDNKFVKFIFKSKDDEKKYNKMPLNMRMTQTEFNSNGIYWYFPIQRFNSLNI